MVSSILRLHGISIKFEYHAEFEIYFLNKKEEELGDQVGPFDWKDNEVKSCASVPLMMLYCLANGTGGWEYTQFDVYWLTFLL